MSWDKRHRSHKLSCFMWMYYLPVLPLLFNGPQFSEAGCNGLTPSESKLCACVDQGLTFNCTINGSGITEWSGSAFDCPGGILLRHLNFMDGTMGICNSGQIVGRSLGVDNGCYSSQLTVNATASLNNTSVQCVHNLLGEKNTIGVISLTVISGLPAQPQISVDIRPGMLVFSWLPNIPSCSLVKYSITYNNCGSCVLTLDTTSATCSNLTLSTVVSVCSFNVRSMACGFSGTLNPNSINVKVPDTPIVQALLPVYESSKNLTGVAANIREETPFNFTDDISGSVLRYIFSFSSTTNPIIINASCDDKVCGYRINNIPTHSSCSQSTGFSITVSAANALGLGPQSPSFYIGCKNQFVEVIYNPDTSTVACNFPKNANYSCSIEYWLCQNTNMKSNTQRNSTVGSDQVLLQIQFSGSVKHCYEVMASNDTFAVIVKGSFDASPGGGTDTTLAVVLGILIPVIFILLLIVVVVVIIMAIHRLNRNDLYEDSQGKRDVDTKTETVACNIENEAKLQPYASDIADSEPSKKEKSSEENGEKVALDAEGIDGGNRHIEEEQRPPTPTYTGSAYKMVTSAAVGLGSAAVGLGSAAVGLGSGLGSAAIGLGSAAVRGVWPSNNPNEENLN